MSNEIIEILNNDITSVREGISILCFTANWSQNSVDSLHYMNEAVSHANILVKVCNVNMDNNQELFRDFSVCDLPYILIMKDSELVMGIDEPVNRKMASIVVEYIEKEIYYTLAIGE